LSAAVARVLVLFTVLFTAGCIFSPGTMTQTVNATPTQTDCPPLPANVTTYISVNHINNFTLGDIVEINGTTNIPGPLHVMFTNYVGWRIGPVQFRGNQTISDTPIPPYSHGGNATIINNDCKERTWSYILDSRDLVNCPGCEVQVWTYGAFNGTGPGHISLISCKDESGRLSWREVRI
jgi:hypothetical protein